MNRTWSFIREETGVFTGQCFTGPERALAGNTPAGCKAVEGVMEIDRSADAELTRARTLDQIEALEKKQHRRVRELLEEADPMLKELGQRIAALRADL